MTNAIASIKDVLKGDEILREMLPNGKSILKQGDAKGDTKVPYITLAEGAKVPTGEFSVLEEYHVRIYDEPAMGTININAILARVQALLHRAEFETDYGVMVRCRFDSSLPLYPDEPLGRNYIEAVYRVRSL